jgi:exodeoxyribonuclease VIII
MNNPLNTLIPASQLSNAAYHQAEGISKSGLDLFARSPAHYRYSAKREPTSAMSLGTATHAAILEPDLYAEQYVILRDAPDRRSSVYKEAVKQRGSEYVLLGKEADQIAGMQEAVRANPHAAALLADGESEQSLFTRDPVTGVIVRVRYDWLTAAGQPVDLKTTQDASDEAFGKSIMNYRYHVQDVLYCDAWEWAFGEQPPPMLFLAVESEMPHCTAIHRIPHDFRQYARKLYRADLNRYAECLESGEWPGLPGEPHTTQMPGWAIAMVENEMELTV